MLVSVLGAKDRNLTKLLKMATQSFADKLLSPQMIKNISLTVVIKNKMQAGGYCDYKEEGLPLPRSLIPRRYFAG